MEDSIAIFDGRMFHDSIEAYSGPTYTRTGSRFLHIDFGSIDTSRLDIERINEEWDVPFLYGDLSKI